MSTEWSERIKAAFTQFSNFPPGVVHNIAAHALPKDVVRLKLAHPDIEEAIGAELAHAADIGVAARKATTLVRFNHYASPRPLLANTLHSVLDLKPHFRGMPLAAPGAQISVLPREDRPTAIAHFLDIAATVPKSWSKLLQELHDAAQSGPAGLVARQAALCAPGGAAHGEAMNGANIKTLLDSHGLVGHEARESLANAATGEDSRALRDARQPGSNLETIAARYGLGGSMRGRRNLELDITKPGSAAAEQAYRGTDVTRIAEQRGIKGSAGIKNLEWAAISAGSDAASKVRRGDDVKQTAAAHGIQSADVVERLKQMHLHPD